MTIKTRRSLLALPLLLALPRAFAHGEEHPKAATPVVKEQKPWGIAAEPAKARRTVDIRMSDDMKMTPNHLEVREGDTLRIRAINVGKVLHEIVIGTGEELKAHADMMLKFPSMQHEEPYMAHVPAGKQGEIVWTFNRPGNFEFACLIAGHFSAGMRGTIRVAPKA